MKLIIVLTIIFFAACSPFQVGQGISIDQSETAHEQYNRPEGNSNPNSNSNDLPDGLYRGLEVNGPHIVFIKISGKTADAKMWDPYYRCVTHVFTNITFSDDGEVVTLPLTNNQLLVDDIKEDVSSRFYSEYECSGLFQ